MGGVGVPHHAEKEDHKKIGIFIAILAVVMAVIAALATREANNMIVKEVQSSNAYAWYQSKRQRTYMNELEVRRIEFELAGSPTEAQRRVLEQSRAKLAAKNAEYEQENKEILEKAEADRRQAQTSAHRHHWFEYAEILMHIAVVFCSLTLLIDNNLYFRLGIIFTVGAIILAGYAFSMKPHPPVTASATGAAGAPSR
jgi:hypothetical protein